MKSVLKSSYGQRVVNLISIYERCREITVLFGERVVCALCCKQEGVYLAHKHYDANLYMF